LKNTLNNCGLHSFINPLVLHQKKNFPASFSKKTEWSGRNLVFAIDKKTRRTFLIMNSFQNSNLIDSSQKPAYDFKKRLYTSYSKFTEVKLITIGIASPLRILQWAEKTLPNGKIYGEVLNANTLHHKTFKPQKGGLFCERIFGPLKDFECSCGKVDKTAKRSTVETDIDVSQNQPLELKDSLNEEDIKKKKKQSRKVRKFCPDCDVEYTWSVIRRYQLGYIKLISPVTHVWFLKGTPSYLSILLDIKKRNLQSVTYCSETLTIEHMDFFGNALQSFRRSGFELDSPSKIYASWMEARKSDEISKNKNFTTTGQEQLEKNKTEENLQRKFSTLSKTNISLNSAKMSLSKQKRLNTINKIKKTIFYGDICPGNFVSATNEKYNTYNLKSTNSEQNSNTNILTPKTKFFIKTNKLTHLKKAGNLVSEHPFTTNIYHENDLKKKVETFTLIKNPFLIDGLNKSKQKKTNFKEFEFRVNKNHLSTIKRKTKKQNHLFVQPDVYSINLNKIYYISSLQVPVSKNQNQDKNSSSFCSLVKKKRFCLLHVLYMLQMSIIYQNLVKNFEANMPFNIQIYFIQKEFMEKQLAAGAYSEKEAKEFRNPLNSNSPLNENFMNFFNEKKVSLFPVIRLDKNGKYIKSKMSASEKRKRKKTKNLKKISKKVPINLYIKSSLETKLHKKIMSLSLLKTWQDIYKNSYLKAMHKVTLYFLSLGLDSLSLKKQENVAIQLKTLTKWRRNEFPKTGDIISNKNLTQRAFGETNTGIYAFLPETASFEFFHKKHKNFVRKSSFKYMKNIIDLIKIYFKKEMLTTLRNLKQPLFSLHFNVQNASVFKAVVTKSDSPTLIPIPLSYSQILNETSENLKNFLSINADPLTDVFARKAFIIPFFLGQFLNEIKDYLILNGLQFDSKNESNVFFEKRVFNGFLQNSSSFWEKKLLEISPQAPPSNGTYNISSQSTSSQIKTHYLNQITLNLQRILSRKKRKHNYDILDLQAYKNALVLSKNLLKKKQILVDHRLKDLKPSNLHSSLYTSQTNVINDKIELNLHHKEKLQIQMTILGSQANVSSLLPFNLLTNYSENLSLLSLNNTKNATLLNKQFNYNRTILKQFLLHKSSHKMGNKIPMLPESILQKQVKVSRAESITGKTDFKNDSLYSRANLFSITEEKKKGFPFLVTSRGSLFYNSSQNELYKKKTENLVSPFSTKTAIFLPETKFPGETKIKKTSLHNNFSLMDNSLQITKSTKSGSKKRLYNNIYTLSHRERWGSKTNEGKDWQIFSLYSNSYASHSSISSDKDQVIYAYKDRLSSISSSLDINSYSKNLPQTSGMKQYFNEINKPSQNVWIKNQPDYGSLMNNSFFSGPGIIQQLLSELNFNEMKKLDKQNRLLLYILNKSIFQLKKQVRLFIYDKSAQAEMRDLCKKRDLLIRRTKLVRKLFRKNTEPSSMILTVLPVLPPDLRPIVKMGDQIAASDLNRFYQRIIYRNDRLKKFLKDPATSNSYEMKYAQRLLQESVDNLIQNGQSGGEKDSRGRVLKSLSDILKGKQGRFRQFLLGKRVDYSGRSVIVVGPKLKLYECGIPLEMALELYLPFLLKAILNKNYSKTVVGAKALIKKNRPLALELLREIMQISPVLLNRAPTLHRLGFQAFVPKLVEGRAILLHPLVCSSFNADFDGDQMAVHVPITIESRAEAWKLMLSRNNMLSPSTGDPLSIPSQDMVLGCYYLTTNANKSTLHLLRGSGFFFQNLDKVLYAYNSQKIDLHALVWVKWMSLIENGNDQEEPVEIRMTGLGNWQELSHNYIRNYNSGSELLNQYMSTTPGRILFYSLIQRILKG